MIPGSAHALMLGGDPCEQYQIGHSVRFNAADTPYLSRTPGVAGNRKTWTWSGWLKRAALGSDQYLMEGFASDASRSFLRFGSEDQLHYANATLSEWVATSQVFRDIAAWVHILLSVDTTQATASDRVKFYINGQQVSAFSATTYPALNSDSWVNAATSQSIGRSHYSAGAGSRYIPGYLSEIHFVDGQALTADEFGFFCQTTGQWRPKAYAGTYGTNGFHLDFSDGSAATAAALGADRSGNGNNWTPTNISVTAGAGNDWLEDTPTNNFATLNFIAGDPLSVLSNGNLDAVGGNSSGNPRYGTQGILSGKAYFEVTYSVAGAGGLFVGVSSDGGAITMAGARGYYSSGEKYTDATPSAYGATFAAGDIIGVALDMDAGTLEFFKNNVSQGVAFTGLSGAYFPYIRTSNSLSQPVAAIANFGQRAFAYTPPAGFKTLCTKNLPRSGTVKVSGSFTGNANADGPFVWMNGTPATLTINGNAVTFGTHADALAGGFKIRTSSASYNAAGTNTWAATIVSDYRSIFRHQNAKGN